MSHSHKAEPLKIGDPLVEWFAVTLQRTFHRHPNVGAIGAWIVRLLLYGWLLTLGLSALRAVGTIPDVLEWASLRCAPRAVGTAILACWALAIAAWFRPVRTFIDEKLPWSLLLLLAVYGVDRGTARPSALACRAVGAPAAVANAGPSGVPGSRSGASRATWAGATQAGSAVPVLRRDLERLNRAMIADRRRTGQWSPTVPTGFAATAGVQVAVRASAAGYVASALAQNGDACRVALTVIGTQAKIEPTRCGRARLPSATPLGR